MRVRRVRRGRLTCRQAPFGKQEIVARVQALLRRVDSAAARAKRSRPTPTPIPRSTGRRRASPPADREVPPDAARAPAAVDVRPAPAAGKREPTSSSSSSGGDAHGVGGDQVKLLRRLPPPGSSIRTSPDAAPIETVRGFGYRYQAPR